MPTLAVLFFLVTVFVPTISFVRPEYLLVGIVVTLGILAKGNRVISQFRLELTFIGLMFISSALGILSQLSTGQEFVWRDAMIFVRLTYYLAVVAFITITLSRISDLRLLNRFIILAALAAAALSLAQYVNLFQINQWLIPARGERYEWLREGVAWRRVIGTLDNPNYWALVCAFLSIIVGYWVIWLRRIKYLPLLLLLAAAVALTGSRTAVVAILSAVVVGGAIIWKRTGDRPKVAAIGATTLVAILLFSFVGIESYYENKSRFTTEQISSLNTRITVWQEAWNSGSKNPVTAIFGQGPRKGEKNVIRFGDNSYILSWRESGVLGLFFYISLLAIMFKRTSRLMISTDAETANWARIMVLLLVAWSVFELAADSWFFGRTASIFLGVYALIHVVALNRTKLHTAAQGGAKGTHTITPPLASFGLRMPEKRQRLPIKKMRS